MLMAEFATAVKYQLPVKVFILNNQYMGMVRQWQQLLHGNRLSHSYTEAMPDFVKLAEAYGGHGIRCEKPGDLDDAIKEMITVKKPVIFDCRVAALANCFPMIPSGKAHNEMLLPDDEHVYAFTRHLDPAMGPRAVQWSQLLQSCPCPPWSPVRSVGVCGVVRQGRVPQLGSFVPHHMDRTCLHPLCDEIDDASTRK